PARGAPTQLRAAADPAGVRPPSRADRPRPPWHVAPASGRRAPRAGARRVPPRREARAPPAPPSRGHHPPAPPAREYYCAGPALRHFRRGSARFKDPAPPAEIPGEMVVAPPAPVERPLWLTVPGASAAVLLAWVVWLVLAALAPALLAASLGPAGATPAVAPLGWWLARRAPEPAEALRRYHLDEADVIAMGPGRTARRLTRSEVVTLTATRHALVLEGRGARLRLPLAAAVRSAL